MIDTRSLLNTLLERSQQATRAGIKMVEDRQSSSGGGNERAAMLKGLGAGALAAGATSMLFGSKGTRKFVKKAAVLGGTAGIGALAYKVISDMQAQQAAASGGGAAAAGGTPTPASNVGTPIDRLAAPEAEARSHAIVQAMIAAARVDGHVDDTERAHISQQIQSLGLERDMSDFLLEEMSAPLDAARIAALATDTESAAEIYVASALVLDADGEQERRYLDTLAGSLKLDPAVTASLEASLASRIATG